MDIQTALAHPITVIIALLAMLGYNYASKRIRQLPAIPLGLFILYALIHLAIHFFEKQIGEGGFLKWAGIIQIVVLYCAITRLLYSILVDGIRSWRGKTLIPKITRDFILFIIYIATAFIVLRTRGNFNPLGLITTSAVLTAIIGLAAQNTLGNLMSGLSIQMERTYRIGDWISFGDHEGRVVGIGWKSTRIRTFENEIVFIPNLDIVKSAVKNYSMPTRTHTMKIDIGVEYGAAPGVVRDVLLNIASENKKVLQKPAPEVRVVDYGDFAITYQLRFDYENYGTNPTLRAEITNGIWYAFRRSGISIPFPIRDVKLHHVERKHEIEQIETLRKSARSDLDNQPILASLSGEDLDTIAKRMTIERYGDGEAIVHQGQSGDSMFIIHRGECDVILGENSRVAGLSASDYFGEMSLLTGEPRTATVRAKGETTLFSIQKALFAEMLSAHPATCESLASALAKRRSELDEIAGRKRENAEKSASKMLSKIKSFFKI
jgi:small-conductance mechanosensitive channel